MNLFGQPTLRGKLIFRLFVAALLAFAAASAAFVLFERLTLEKRARQVMEPYAQLVSVGAEAAVAFADARRAREILETLRTTPQILEAQIELGNGELLARYGTRSSALLHLDSNSPDGVYVDPDRNTAVLVRSLKDDAHLTLVLNLNELDRQTRDALLAFAAGMVVLLVLVATGLLAALQRAIVGPIATLAETVEQVRSSADFSRRVPTSGADEVARLGQSFNAMMGAIEEREDGLRGLTLFQRTILDNVAHGIISTDPDGRVTSFNHAAERLLGYLAEEVVGKQTPACWHDAGEVARYALRLSTELGETVAPGFAVFAARPQRNQPEENEWTFIRKDGTRVPVLLSVTALRAESGRISGFVGMTYDLTERKRGEENLKQVNERFSLATRAARLGIWDWNLPQNELVWDDRMYELYGVKREDFAGAYEAWLAGVHPDDRAACDEISKQARCGEREYDTEFRVVWPDGSVHYLKAYGQFVRDAQGRALRMTGVNFDITERKQAEEELRRYKDQLEETVQQRTAELRLARDAAEAANQAKSTFLASMSHELRTPLNGILGYAQILQRDKVIGERNAAALDVIRQSGEHLLELINDILDLTRIETGKLELTMSDIPLPQFLRVVAEIIGVRAQQKGIEFICDLAPDLPECVRGDERRLRQVLLNLLANAVKFTDHGRVMLRVGRVGASRLSFAVEDTGIGIAPSELERIFQPFEQVGDLQRQSGGTGLGLTISRQLVRHMGGDITVESRVGGGSIFSFEMELETVNPAPATRLSAGVAVGYRGPRRKILLVDDDAANRAVLADLFVPAGFEIVEARDGVEALELAQSELPDIVLLDIVMPRMDGHETTRRLRRLPALAQVPIIALSASASKADEGKCLEDGVDVFLSKPIDQDKLLAKMAALLRLEWITVPATDVPPPMEVPPASSLIAPPHEEMQELQRLAQMGNMRDIVAYAEHIAGLDPSYQPFAAQLRRLADGYRSKAIVAFVEGYLHDPAV